MAAVGQDRRRKWTAEEVTDAIKIVRLESSVDRRWLPAAILADEVEDLRLEVRLQRIAVDAAAAAIGAMAQSITNLLGEVRALAQQHAGKKEA